MAGTRGRRRMPRAERVQQVLAAAARAFARSGFAATSMDEIAAEAGISKLMIYRDFEGKREQPDAFMLLFRHAAREPEFAAYAEDFSASAIETSERRLAADIQDPVALRWTARMAFRLTIEAVIAWLEVGDPARDQAFLEAMTVPFSWARQAAAKVAGEPRTSRGARAGAGGGT